MPRPTPTPPAPPPPGYLTVAQAAVYLGLTEHALRARLALRQIPYRRWTRRTLIFSIRELDAFIAALDGCTLQEALDNLEEELRYGR